MRTLLGVCYAHNTWWWELSDAPAPDPRSALIFRAGDEEHERRVCVRFDPSARSIGDVADALEERLDTGRWNGDGGAATGGRKLQLQRPVGSFQSPDPAVDVLIQLGCGTIPVSPESPDWPRLARIGRALFAEVGQSF